MGHWYHHQKVVREYETKISDLKNKVAPQHIGACALLLNPQGQVLLGKRKNSYKAGFYGLPGGRVEPNEPIIKAIGREVKEETGMVIKNLDYLGVVRENQGDHDFIHFVYIAKNVTQKTKLCEPEKCTGWAWLDMNSVDKSILPGHLAAIQLYQQQSQLIDLINQSTLPLLTSLK